VTTAQEQREKRADAGRSATLRRQSNETNYKADGNEEAKGKKARAERWKKRGARHKKNVEEAKHGKSKKTNKRIGENPERNA